LHRLTQQCLHVGEFATSKTAVQYICPYIMKAKYPLEQCLIVIRDVLRHNKLHPSQSTEDSGTSSRDTKYFLQGILNRMNVLAEISDYQVAAKLINLPTAIFTDSYAYINPGAYMAYRIQKEIDSNIATRIIAHNPNIVPTNNAYPVQALIESLGHVQCFSITDGNTQRKCLIPTVMIYEFRSFELEFMNRVEFECLIHIANKREQCESSKNRQFLLSPNSGLTSSKALFLSAKHKIPLFTRRVPSHPGLKPTEQTGPEFNLWMEKANQYASYFLTMYRPEPFITNSPPLQYTWDTLETWITQQCQSNTAFGICRVMLMHRRMQSMYTNNQTQQMLNDYRSTPRDLWSTEMKNRIANSHYEKDYSISPEEIDDEQWNLTNSVISQKDTAQLYNNLKWSDMQLRSLQNLIPSFITDTNSSQQHPSCTNPSNLIPPLEAKQVQLRFREIRQDDQLNKGNLPYSNTSEPHDTSQTTNENPVTNPSFITQPPPTLANLVSKYFPQQPTQSQLQFFTMYIEYFLHPQDTSLYPPSVVLATGAAGTGKTVVVNAIIDAATSLGYNTIRTACNNINAADIHGHTTASLLNLRNNEVSLTNSQLDNFAQLTKTLHPTCKILLIIFDEVSNECPEYLAKMSHACQQALHCYDMDFGGLPVLLLGDLGQMPPVKKQALHTSAINLAIWNRDIYMHQQQQTENKSKYDQNHPFTIGTNIFTKARWFEFKEQMRSTNAIHTSFIGELYSRHPIKTEDIKTKYQLLHQDDLTDCNSVWLTAPVLVATNRERYTLTPIRAILYAKHHHQPVIRWPRKYTRWAQQPVPSKIDQCIANDTCFYEYYVQGGPCHVTQNFNKYRLLLNGTPAWFHSTTLDSNELTEHINYLYQHGLPGDVITLENPPTSINIQLHANDNETLQLWKNFTLVTDQIVIPICEGMTSSNKETTYTPVHGGLDYLPSKVKLESRFGVEASFAMTIHKAEGQTMPNAILALSKPPVRNLTYCHLYVAFSRVRGCDNIRLLLNGDQQVHKWDSIAYIDCLRADKHLNAFFAGYHNQRNQWKQNTWDPQRALDSLVHS